MKASPDSPEFHGSTLGLAKQMIVAVLPIAATISFLLFGPLGARMLLISLAIVPVLLVFAWLIARFDRIRFDDSEQVIRRTLRPPLPYGRITRVRFVESLGVVQSVVHMGSRTEILTVGLIAEEGDDLRGALRSRCPDVQFDARGYSGWKLTVAMVALLFAAYLAGSFYLERRFPAIATACAEAPEPGAPSLAGAPIVREGEGIVVSVPRELERTRFTVGQMTRIRESGRAGQTFLKIAGFQTEFELFHYAACARYGLIPNLLKGVLLSRWADPSVYPSHRNGTLSLLISGRRDGKTGARILLYDEPARIEAFVVVDLSDEFSLTTLATLLPRFTVAPATSPGTPPS